MSQYNNIFIWCFIEKQCRFCHQRMEPSTGLIHGLGNELCRELRFKQFFVFKWIVILCKRHCSGIKPAVNNFRHTFHLLAAIRAGKCHTIDIWAVKFQFFCGCISGTLCQFFPASDTFLVSTAFTLPDIERSSPITVTGDRPILNIL